ncbi:SgcJ/EcaC family oxidoreductase, partial [Streptomyces vinaceus]|uniref:SgcJ/EcaC family oxidoreductase n=1 Tax=Streptomyces vinaceus TaxID=1960 RepID=UPI0036BAEE65
MDDLAELFVAAVERAGAGTLWHGVGESAVPVRDLARAACHAAGVLAAPPPALPSAGTPDRPGAVAGLTSGSCLPVEVFGAPEGPETDAEVEHSRQNERVDQFLSLFRRQDPVWTTGHGKRLSGLEEMAALTHQVLPGATAGSTAVYDVARVLFLRPDVAAVNVRRQPPRRDGTRMADRPEGRPCSIPVKEDGGWRVSAPPRTPLPSTAPLPQAPTGRPGASP